MVRGLIFGLLMLTVPLTMAAQQLRAEPIPAAAASCLKCHGMSGLLSDVKTPVLHGQDRDYLRHQIKAFQREFCDDCDNTVRFLARRHPVMSDKAAKIEEESALEVVDWFSKQVCFSARYIDGQRATQKPELSRIAKCLTCHGPEGRNLTRFVPNLAGQRFVYLIRQLISFRDTKPEDLVKSETARTHKMMTRQGGNLTDEVLIDIAAYFAGLPCR